MEEFRTVQKYPAFKVSNLGRVLNTKTGNYLGSKSPNGYWRVDIKGKSVKIHLLVAAEFLDHRDTSNRKIVVDHIDGDKNNNRLDNLQVISQSLNTRKGKGAKGEDLPEYVTYTDIRGCKYYTYTRWKDGKTHRLKYSKTLEGIVAFKDKFEAENY